MLSNGLNLLPAKQAPDSQALISPGMLLKSHAVSNHLKALHLPAAGKPALPQTFHPTPEETYYSLYERHIEHLAWSILCSRPSLSDALLHDLLARPDAFSWMRCSNSKGRTHSICGVFQGQIEGEEDVQLYIILQGVNLSRRDWLDQMRLLGQDGCAGLPFWPAMAGAMTAASRSERKAVSLEDPRGWSLTPAYLAYLVDHLYQAGQVEAKAEAIRQMAQEIVRFGPSDFSNPALSLGPSDLDAPGLALLLLELGQALWQPQARRRLAQPQIFAAPDMPWQIYKYTADVWLNLTQPEQAEVTFNGQRLVYQMSGMIRRGLWKQVLQFERWPIPAEALRYLFPRMQVIPAPAPRRVDPQYDPVYGDALAESLVAEAQQKMSFVPYGAFRTAIPSGAPLAGYRELCLWADGQGLWALPNPGGQIFYWRPQVENILRNPHWDDLTASAMNITLAALWCDLVSEGERVFVRQEAEPELLPAAQRVDRRRSRRPGASRRQEAALLLPSQRILRLEGAHAWGAEDELEKIRRAAHQVRGHRRRLNPNQQRSRYALENARRFGFILPDGYTFVRPHVAGLKSETAPDTHIIARGLASLLLTTSSRKENAHAEHPPQP